MDANPVIVEVTRGGMVESRHRAAIAVTDARGRVAFAAGDIDRPIYPRSAIKPMQALALVESGAADRYALGDAEIALACASHAGERRHVETVLAWLARIGLGEADLECGAHAPADAAAQRALAGREPGPAYNNCSGKHAGFLSVARHLGYPTKGYIKFEHPVQQMVLGTLEQLAGCDLGAAPRGIDGCGIPVYGMPLGNLAMAAAQLADPHNLPDKRAAAVRRVLDAMAAEPGMIAGSGRFGTRVAEIAGQQALVKGGAEGVYIAVLRDAGLGAALKIDDGSGRAAEVVMGAVLRKFDALGPFEATRLKDALAPTITNWVGREVGAIRIAADAPL
jgi:L-asparaginase II